MAVTPKTTLSKRETLRKTFSTKSGDSSSPTALQRTPSGSNFSTPKNALIFDNQTENPDQFDLSINDYVGTNKYGDITGFKRVHPPTMGKAPNKHGEGERDVAVDSGVFRRFGFHKKLVSGDDCVNTKKNPVVLRPMPDYLDGTSGSLFDRSVLLWPNMQFYGVRVRDPATRKMKPEYTYRTTSDLNGHAENLAKALIAYDFVQLREFHDETYPNAKKLRTLAMMLPNREEFHIIDQACSKAKIAMVPAYPSLGMDSCKAIFQEVQAASLVTDYKTLVKLTSSTTTKSGSWGLDHLILVDSVEPDVTKKELAYLIEGTPEYEKLQDMMKVIGVKKLVRFANVLKMGQKIRNATVYPADRERPAIPNCTDAYVNAAFNTGVDGDKLYESSPFAKAYPKTSVECVQFDICVPDDVQTICYTSGTTGMPKGVIITHQNITAVAVAGACGPFQTPGMTYGQLEHGPHVLDTPDATYSVLPLVHVFERLITALNYILGVKICMFSQDPSQLVPEMKMCQPTIFAGVPRIFQKILAGVDELVSQKSFVVKALYNSGLNTKTYYSEQSGATTHRLWDNVVFNKIRDQVTGGQLKVILTGAAPLAASTQYRTESLLSLNMIEGYGLTESMGGTAVRLIGDAKGAVGTVMPSVEIKLEAVPEMDLVDIRDQMKGEICIRGNSITPGYFRRPDLNKESFKGGWFHTGDVGQIQGGLLSIRDRKKAIFKLAQGEYISPERLEGFLLSALPWLENIMVTGRSTSRFACALVVLNPTRIPGWTEGNVTVDSNPAVKSRWEAHLKEKDSEIKKTFLDDQLANMSVFDIQGYEKVMAIEILPYNLTDPELITPTMKLKRNKVRIHYESTIDKLCDQIDAANVGK